MAKRPAFTDEIEEMMISLKDIGKLVDKLDENLLANTDLLDSFPIWKSNLENKEIVISWNNMRSDLISLPSYLQTSDKDDSSWAIALSKAITILMKMTGSTKLSPTPLTLRDGVGAQHVTSTGGIDNLKSAIPFVTRNYVDRMTIRHRPKLCDEDQLEIFEECIIKLLARGPVAVSFDYLPTFKDYHGKGIYVPTALDCERRLWERLPMQCDLLTGFGVQLQGESATEFWEVQGKAGFFRLARHKGLIRHVFELEV